MCFHNAVRTCACLGCLLLAIPALAATKNNVIEEVVVLAHPLSGEGLAQVSDILEGDALDRRLDSSLGATLAHLPGVHSASFGTAVGRPVIHGLAGPRIRVMEDRIDTLDLSVTSADHATSVEPFTADRIEVLKGASTLLYGSGAIGGVVDVHTGRIPHHVPDALLAGRAEVRSADNAQRTTAALRLDGGAGDFAWHADGFERNAGDYHIDGKLESAALRAEEAEAGEAEVPERNRVRGTEQYTKGGAVGVSKIWDNGFAGISASWLEADYGLPGAHAHESEAQEEEGEPRLAQQQNRVDIELGMDAPVPLFDHLNLRIGHNNYKHREIEGSGEVGTRFANDAWEGRLELVHGDKLPLHGALGAQFMRRSFSAVGEEAFIPPVTTRQAGLFWVGERDFGSAEVEFGARAEQTRHRTRGISSRRFDTFALSTGVILPLGSATELRVHLDYSTRAPVAEELFSDGPHLVTGAVERGDANLDEEKALNLAVTLDQDFNPFSLALTGYVTRFKDFIYQRNTGLVEDDLPVLQYTQGNAQFIGLDARASWTLAETAAGNLSISAFYDLVYARLREDGGDDLPRIPPQRAGFGLLFEGTHLNVSVDYTRVFRQDEVAELELPTRAYNDLRVYAGYGFVLGAAEITAFVSASNLTDAVQRNHASFIKDTVPLPGRTVEAGLRINF